MGEYLGKVPEIIVQMSGKLEEDENGKELGSLVVMKGSDLIKMVGDKWGVKLAKVEEPFVVVHDRLKDEYRVVEAEGEVGEVDGEREVVRVVLPLRGVEKKEE